MKIGSLFDGSGGFPLAGSLCGIEPTWASEVEPYPIAVTRSRFPQMKHLGSVTDVKGYDAEPVDVITFGSPCQDLSVAGKRAGLKHTENGDDETTRSGLFIEAVRIIKEMREATNGKYPRFAVWENVPGAFSSNKGEDFRIVLEELIKVAEPTAVMPAVPKNGWPYSDLYYGDGWSLAYRVFDAQYWGVPQRRRRIYLVADFRGECAGKVLFEREGLRGNFAESGTPWKAAAGDAESGVGTADCKRDSIVYAIDKESWTSGQGFNRAPGITMGGPCPTLQTGGTVHAVAYPIENHPADSRVNIDDSGKVQTLTSRMGTGGGNVPMVMEPMVYESPMDSRIKELDDGIAPTVAAKWHKGAADTPLVCEPRLASGNNVTGCLMASGYEKLGAQEMFSGDYTVIERKPTYCLQGNGIDRADTAGCNGKGWAEDTCYTLNTIDRPAVAYALDRASFNQGENAKYDFEITDSGINSTLTARGPSAVCCTTGSFMQVTEEVTPTLMARDWKDPNVVAFNYIVRRLTPTECARLQGFPDKWGHPDVKTELTDEEYAFWLDARNLHAAINGKATKEYTKEQMLTWYNKLHTDSSEYKLWGNGIALPCAIYVMQGIAEALNEN